VSWRRIKQSLSLPNKLKDITALKENEFEVEAVVSFYTIFHIPRKKTPKTL